MKKILVVLTILLSISSVFAISCQQQCEDDGYDYYVCSGTDYTGHSECQAQTYFSYCYHSYVEKVGTECYGQCFCYEINMCGEDNTECSSACSSTGCSGTTFDMKTPTNLPTDTFVGDTSNWDIDIENTGSIGMYAYIECHVEDPNGVDYYTPAVVCAFINSGSTQSFFVGQSVDEAGTWQLHSCTVYEMTGTGICNPPYVYRDSYDFYPEYTWEVTSSDCPLTTLGQCTSSIEGEYTCFGNHIGKCEYYPTLGIYCWTDFADCVADYDPDRYCWAGSCLEYDGTTTTTTTTGTTTTTTSTSTTTTTTEDIPVEDMGEPFETDDMPDELKFLSNMGSGLFNMTSSIVGGLLLLVMAFSVATIVIIIGKRSIR